MEELQEIMERVKSKIPEAEENTQDSEPLSKSELYGLYDTLKGNYVIPYEIMEKREVKILKKLIGAGIARKFIFADIKTIPASLRKATEGFSLGKSYYIFGDIGSGKTYLLSALIRERIIDAYDKKRWGELPVMESVPSILLAIKSCFREGSTVTEEGIIYRYTKCECLVLDDLGTEKLSEWVLQTLYTIVDNRYRDERQTVFTSNLSLDQIRDRVGDRIPSRIAEMCDIVALKGADRRIKK